MRAEIIAVGSELLSFGRAETNSLFLASQLIPLGIRIPRKYVVADSPAAITECLELALKCSDVVVLTGGLGPTNDDLTRETVADFLNRPLIEDSQILLELKERYERFGLILTENNRKQAKVPEGAAVLPNPRGSAPGLCLTEDGKIIFLLPGPPRELNPMTIDFVIPTLRQRGFATDIFMRRLKVAGEAESRVDARIDKIYKEYREVDTTILSSPGVISLYFTWVGSPQDQAMANRTLDELSLRVKASLGQAVYAETETDLPEAVAELLKGRRITVATAESCTGGQIAKLLTDVPGVSECFLGGVVCYSNRSKETQLHVSREDLERFGAVSKEVAEQMADGVRSAFGADLGLSVTGIAGPRGGSPEKPVGTVFLGLASSTRTRSRKLNLPGDREAVRLRTSRLALDWVRRELL